MDAISEFQTGDRCTRKEFDAWYVTTPKTFKAELIEGVVYVPFAADRRTLASSRMDLAAWLGSYKAATDCVRAGCNCSVLIDEVNEWQPDVVLFFNRSARGQVVISTEGFMVGAPEFAGEVVARCDGIELSAKKDSYRRHGVSEYLIWHVSDGAIDWFMLRDEQYDRLLPDSNGIIRSETFPGLWLDVPALLRRDLATVLGTLQLGIASPEHATFVQKLQVQPR